MVKKKCCQVDSHLQCKSTASLNNQIVEDLQKEDKPLAQILEERGIIVAVDEEDEEEAEDAQE
jgi:hypothetical protein